MFIWNIFSFSDHKHLDDIWFLSLIWTFFTSITPNGIIKINDLAVVLNIMGQGFINDITDKSNNVGFKGFEYLSSPLVFGCGPCWSSINFMYCVCICSWLVPNVSLCLLSSSPVLWSGIRVVHFVLLYVFTFLVPYCDVHCNFRVKMIFGSSLPPVVCRMVHDLFTLFVFVCA